MTKRRSMMCRSEIAVLFVAHVILSTCHLAGCSMVDEFLLSREGVNALCGSLLATVFG